MVTIEDLDASAALSAEAGGCIGPALRVQHGFTYVIPAHADG